MDGWITIGTKVDNKHFDRQIEELETKIKQIEKDLSLGLEQGASEKAIKRMQLDLEKAKNKLVQLNTQKAKLEKTTGIDNLGKSFRSSIKSAGKLALAIFGIRSAYMLVRRASSDLAGYDEQYATNLEYIRFVLTQTIAPALKYIVELAGQLLQYIGAITQELFGFNVFANGSVEAFKKMKNNAKGVGKAVNDLKKQLAGFDELNVLKNDSSSGGGIVSPSFDVTALEGQGKDWMTKIADWIKSNQGIVLAAIGGLITAIGIKFAALPVVITGILGIIWGLFVQNWDNIKSWIQGGIDWLFGQSDTVYAYCGEIITTIYNIFVEGLQLILNYVDVIVQNVKRTFNNFMEFFQAIFVGDWATAWKKILDIATNPLVFLKDLWGTILGFFENTLQHLTDFLSGKSDWVRSTFGDLIGDLYDNFVKNITIVKDLLSTYISNIKTILENVISFIKNVFTGNWSEAWKNLQNIFIAVFQNIGKTITSILQIVWNNVSSWATSIGKAIGDAVSGAFKFVVNGILSMIENTLNGPIRTINRLSDDISAFTAGIIRLPKISTFKLPRLAVGGIVNMPNTGTLVGGAIAGESGREGVLPLTDTQTMAELGREIGRWITINANITNTMNGRVISRELKHIQNEQDFAYNT